ncbi:MAG: SPFH domain-containing protein [Lachnospiraceae bacterium]|nr:SPFH domain-containing protein [Lachnospiraceae bacterium]
MGLFDKNPNEAAFVGGKKHWTDVIKNSGPGELLLWRQPEEDFNTNSTLIVMPGETAVFIKGGTVEQVFENGTYKLDTDNYPFISRLRNAFSGGISTFNCVVYFFRQADSEEIKWGTESPITVRDKMWGVVTTLRSYGAYRVRIDNPALFLEKLVGNNVPFQTQMDLNRYFSSCFQGKIKSSITKAVGALDTELIGLDAHLEEFAENVKPMLNEELSEYGLKCVKFSMASLSVDTSKYDDIDSAQVEAIKLGKLSQAEAIAKVNLAQGDKGVMEVLGDDWARQKSADILGTLAANPGGAGAAGAAGAGIGMGMAAGSAFSNMASQMFAPMTGAQPQAPVQQPVGVQPSGRFTPKGETPAAAPASNGAGESTSGAAPAAEDPVAVLTKLKMMLDNGLIEQAEYDAKKQEILSRM